MAEEIEEAQAPGTLSRLRDHAAAWATENPRTAILSRGLFCVLTFLVYWYARTAGRHISTWSTRRTHSCMEGWTSFEFAKNVNVIEKACNAFRLMGAVVPARNCISPTRHACHHPPARGGALWVGHKRNAGIRRHRGPHRPRSSSL
jgi:hypothetical protein